GGRTEERLLEMETAAFVTGRDRGRVITQPHFARDRLRDRAVDESHVAELDLSHRELFAAPHHQRVRGRIDLEHVPGTGFTQVPETAALSDRVDGGPAVGAKLAAGGVDHGAGTNGQA